MANAIEILLIEDDPQIRRFIRASLTAEGFRYHEAFSAAEGIAQAQTRQPALILLDLGLPDHDGLDVIRALRLSSQVPILVLSARGQEKDKIEALDAGADDFVSKPFAIGELLARIRAALRRAATIREDAEGAIFRAGNITIDLAARLTRVNDTEIHLTPIEFRLLETLVRHAGKVITQRQLLIAVWGPQHSEEAQYLRVYMTQLRRKLEADPTRPRHLRTEPGVGYRFVID